MEDSTENGRNGCANGTATSSKLEFLIRRGWYRRRIDSILFSQRSFLIRMFEYSSECAASDVNMVTKPRFTSETRNFDEQNGITGKKYHVSSTVSFSRQRSD